MKKCPICEKTFEDSMRFCQTDGTPLLDFTEEIPDDPLKTTVVRQDEIASLIPPEDPFKTSLAVSQPSDQSGDLLQLPEEFDPMKTIVARETPKPDLSVSEPPTKSVSPFDEFSTPVESKEEFAPTPPNFSEPSLSPPNFGDMSAPQSFEEQQNSSDEPPPTAIYMPQSSPFSSEPAAPNEAMSSSPFKKPLDSPNLSPFSNEPSSSYDNPPVAPYKEPESAFSNQQSSPFDQPAPIANSPFDRQDQGFDQPAQQSDWNPPPAPVSNWQDQGLGANTPFKPPVATSGQSQGLAIASIGCGVASLLMVAGLIIPFLNMLCGIVSPALAIAAIITGFLARSRAKQNPNQYGGSGLALGGIITGGLTLLAFVGIILLVVLFFGFASFR